MGVFNEIEEGTFWGGKKIKNKVAQGREKIERVTGLFRLVRFGMLRLKSKKMKEGPFGTT